MTDALTIAIADDHALFRQGLRQALELDAAVRVVGEAATGPEAVALIDVTQPHVAVLDIRMPGLDGLEVARRVMPTAPRTRVVVLTMHDSEDLVREALDIGVSGYVLKDDAVAEVTTCVRAVAEGGTYVSPRLTKTLLAERAGEQRERRALATLTRTEREVLRLLAQGQSNREIAEVLFVSVRTAESHRYHICQKLGLSGTHALVRFVARHREVL